MNGTNTLTDAARYEREHAVGDSETVDPSLLHDDMASYWHSIKREQADA